MSFLGILIPVAILGLIVWAVVGFTRRGGEPFTLATATALYARVALIGGVLMSLIGVGTIIKVGFGFINVAYSYYQQYAYANGAYPGPVCKGVDPASCPPVAPLVTQNSFYEQQRGQDLVLGITLLVIGVVVVVGHLYLARAVARMAGGSPAWVARGTQLALTVMTAIVGIPSAAFGLYGMLSYFIVGTSQQNQQPWGESLGLAIAFVPAWIYFMLRLVQDLRRPHVGATSQVP
ncbi:MAG TPA: hypothetical protein VGU71_02570 [Candidatus Dormibacteraeota bacterium]|nr:hypothetical protein [Candidatus Dormibacteraeota bacterium]